MTPLARFLAEVLRIEADRTLTPDEAHTERVEASLQLLLAESADDDGTRLVAA